MVMQLRHDEKIFDERFASMRELNRRGKTPDPDHYEVTYYADLPAMWQDCLLYTSYNKVTGEPLESGQISEKNLPPDGRNAIPAARNWYLFELSDDDRKAIQQESVKILENIPHCLLYTSVNQSYEFLCGMR